MFPVEWALGIAAPILEVTFLSWVHILGFSSVLLAERAVGKFVWLPHSVVIRPVLTWPGMLCALQGHPPATTGVSAFSNNSDLGIEPLLFFVCCFEVSSGGVLR